MGNAQKRAEEVPAKEVTAPDVTAEEVPAIAPEVTAEEVPAKEITAEDDKNTKLFNFTTCPDVPVRGGRVFGRGGLVEVDGSPHWGVNDDVYCLESSGWVNSCWTRRGGGVGIVVGARLGVCGGRVVSLGGLTEKDDGFSKAMIDLLQGRWSSVPDMLVGCARSCVVSVSRDCMVVMGGRGSGPNGPKDLDDVQVFNYETHTWHRGASLPQPCSRMSAVVHGDLVLVMGGYCMGRAVWCTNIHELTMAHTQNTEQSIWRKLPDVPYVYSSVCVVDGVLLAIGGREEERDGAKETSGIYAFHHVDQEWKHVGDLPFECSLVDVQLLPGGELMVVDGTSQRVLKIIVKGLAKLFPITPHASKADEKSQHSSGAPNSHHQDYKI